MRIKPSFDAHPLARRSGENKTQRSEKSWRNFVKFSKRTTDSSASATAIRSWINLSIFVPS